jgi:hypothetical protein
MTEVGAQSPAHDLQLFGARLCQDMSVLWLTCYNSVAILYGNQKSDIFICLEFKSYCNWSNI